MKVEIYSETGNGSKYTIDTEAVTCTCPSFKFHGSRYPKSDEQRLCKHLAKYLSEHPELKPIELIKADQLRDAQIQQSDGKTRYMRGIFDPYVDLIRSTLESFPEVSRFEFCGSYRRKADMVSDLDVLIELKPDTDAEGIFNYFENFLQYIKLWRGPIKAAYIADGFIHIDFKIVPAESWPFATLHFTGSKIENISLRRRANSMNLKLNEYGLYNQDGTSIELKSEKEIYEYLGLNYKLPWER